MSSFLFCPGANLIYGINGSGKTSLLEAIYLLGRGRSFRSRNIRTVIQHDTDDCIVFGQLHEPASSEGRERDIPVGVHRTRKGDFRFKGKRRGNAHCRRTDRRAAITVT